MLRIFSVTKKEPKNILSVFLIRSSVMESVVSAVLLLLDTFERIQINSRTMVNPNSEKLPKEPFHCRPCAPKQSLPAVKNNISFLKGVSSVTFCLIFLFANSDAQNLVYEGLYVVTTFYRFLVKSSSSISIKLWLLRLDSRI